LEGWRVIIIGKGPNKKKLINLIESLNLSNQIEILSNIKNIHDYYMKASLFVFTSKAEGFPNALLEAMHFGLPCISTDCNYGPSDLITDGKDGFLVPVNNQEALIEKIDKLIKDDELKAFFSKNAAETSLNYTSEKVTEKWKNVINQHL
jgi:GalNAc-alpha-(1->4)-GalNAc-alpha-(1->3)-diNAcBac-PP-undecaprenol alpha-1,4-N-acetyl-D-galactosaminyltransferase